MCPNDQRGNTPHRVPLPRAFDDTTALGLGAVLVGGFDDDKIRSVPGLPAALGPTALICVDAT